ncbi:MAG: hypothetical protein JWQ66_1287 [Mucilaginibacter sp.]|nr:hypothetical protein [Mucilaginibacter sp.]
MIVATKEIADILVKEWLKLWTPQFTYSKGQYSKPVINKEKALLEIIKYGSKIFTEPDVNNKSTSTVNRTIHAAAFNNILLGMKGLRIFERFGFDLPKQQIAENPKSTETTNYNTWEFDLKNHDWLNILNDEALTDYKPEFALVDLLENRIDTNLE